MLPRLLLILAACVVILPSVADSQTTRPYRPPVRSEQLANPRIVAYRTIVAFAGADGAQDMYSGQVNLDRAVNQAIASGWQPYGPLQVESDWLNWYVQPMVKYGD